jgi:cell division protein FtsQ
VSPAPAQARFRPEKAAFVRRQDALEGGWQVKAKALAWAVLRTAAAMGVSALLVLAGLEGSRWARSSPVFGVRSISVRGNVNARAEELVSRSGLLPGQNLFKIDLAGAARGVESSPWVTSAQVSRRFPMAIEIEVTEHAPAARASLGSVYLVNNRGLVFKRAADEDAGLVLPLITGISRAEWEEKRAQAQQQLLVAIGFCEAWRSEGLAAEDLLEIQLGKDGVTAFARDGAVERQEIAVGEGPFGPKLRKLFRIREALARRSEQAARLDLDNRARPETVAAQLITSDKAAPRSAPASRGRE